MHSIILVSVEMMMDYYFDMIKICFVSWDREPHSSEAEHMVKASLLCYAVFHALDRDGCKIYSCLTP